METANSLQGYGDCDVDNAERLMCPTDGPLYLVDDCDGDGGFGLSEQDSFDMYLTKKLLQHGDSDEKNASIEHDDVKLYITNNFLHSNDNDGLIEQDVPPELNHHDDDDGLIEQCMIKLPRIDELLHHGDDGGLIEQDIIGHLTGDFLHSDDGGGEGERFLEEDTIKSYLTDDLLHLVFSFLDQNSLCISAMVCRQWHIASLHQEFWQSLSFVGEHVTGEKVAWLCLKYPKAIGLSLKEVPCVEEVAREAMYSLKGLKRLELHKGNLTDSFFNALADGCCDLQELSVNDIILGHGWSEEVLICHENLNQLKVIECKVRRITIRCPLLNTLSLKRTNMSYITLLCPILHSLDMSSCPKLSDANIHSAISACSLLSNLDVSHSYCVSDATVQGIASVCRNLCMLDVSQCPNLTTGCVPYPILRGMRLQTSADICNTTSFLLPMYKSINPDLCTFLTSATLNLQLLHKLTSRNFHKYIDLILRHPLRMSISLSTSFMLDMNISPLALQRLLFRQQPSFTTMSLQNPLLNEMKLSQSDFSGNFTSRLCTNGTGYYGFTSISSTHYQDRRLITSNYFVDASHYMRVPSNLSRDPNVLSTPLKMLKLDVFVRWFGRIDPNGLSKGYDWFKKRKQLCLWLSTPQEKSMVQIKEQAFCFQVQMHKKHGLIMGVNSKIGYFHNTIKSFNDLRDSYNDDNSQDGDPGSTSLNIPKYLKRGVILDFQNCFCEDERETFFLSGVRNVNNYLNFRVQEKLAMLYHMFIQIWQQSLQFLNYDTACDSLCKVHGKIMLEGALNWSYLLQNYFVGIYDDNNVNQLSKELPLFQEQDYLVGESRPLVEYSFELQYLVDSRSPYNCVRNFCACVNADGGKLSVSDSVFASIISQFTNWTGFPYSQEFGYRGMNGNFSVDLPILVNCPGVSAVSYLNLRTLQESDLVCSKLFEFSFQVALQHNLDSHLTNNLKIKTYVYRYSIFDTFQQAVVDLPFMLTFDGLIFSWAQKELLAESIVPVQSICTPAFMCKHDLDLLPLEFMCNLATLYLPYAHVPDTLSAISTTQLMKLRRLAVAYLADILLQFIYTKREYMKINRSASASGNYLTNRSLSNVFG